MCWSCYRRSLSHDLAAVRVRRLDANSLVARYPTHQSARTLREYRVPHEEESPTPFKDAAGQGRGSLRLDVVTDHGTLFSENSECIPFSLMFDVTVANPLGRTAPARAGTRAEFAPEEAVNAKDTKYGGTCRPTYNYILLAFSPRGDYYSSVQDLVKDLGKIKVETAEDYLEAPDVAKLGIQARKTDRLRLRLSIVPQKALAYRRLRYVGCQQILGSWRRKPGTPTWPHDVWNSLPKRTRRD